MLENFCRVTAFDEIITKDTGLLHDMKYKARPQSGTKMTISIGGWTLYDLFVSNNSNDHTLDYTSGLYTLD